MKKKRQVSRREFMRISAFTTAGAVLVACGGAPAEAPAGEATAAPAAEAAAEAAAPVSAGGFSEAPMLAELVAAGTLPAVDERLPENPLVMEVAESIGNYGGTLRRGFKGVSDRWGPTKHVDRLLVWWDKDLIQRPRMVESYELSDDATTWTFHLRPGMKWSDGAPVTTADVVWWWENYATNTDIFPGGAANNWVSGEDRTPMVVEAVDDYTFTFTYADPKPLVILSLGRGINDVLLPGHYLAQFHADLTEDADALQAQIEEAGFNSWNEYFEDRTWWYLNPDRPTLGGWVAKNGLSEELFVMERNPYFFAVDAEGQQLPYVDNINHRIFETNDVFDLRIINGEVDFQARHVNLANFTLYKENEADGDYQMFVGKSSGHPAMQLNLTVQDERLSEFFNKRETRIAMSVAVDRDAINELVFDGLMTPRQYSPIEISPQAYPEQANAYIEYDPDMANQMLDEAGYSEKNNDGMRVWPGTDEPISFVIEGIDQPGSQNEDFINELAKYFAEVGVQATYRYVERSLYTEHFLANDIQAGAWGGDRTVVPLAAPIIWTGEQPDRPWCPGWSQFRNTGGADPNSQEPPEGHWMWDIWNLWDTIQAEPDPEQQTALFHQILDIWAEELPMIGYLGEGPSLIIVKNGLRNYLPGMPVDDPTGDEHLLNTETYFWENPA